MTDRERWIVYPLLFLALGAGVKDKVLHQTDIEMVVCEKLVVHDPNGQQQIVISSTPVGGRIAILGPRNGWDVLLGYVDKFAGLMFVDGRGRLIRSLATMPANAVAPANRAGREWQEPPRQPADEQPAQGEQPSDEKPPEQPDEPTPEQ
jgi:hypothetical protein